MVIAAAPYQHAADPLERLLGYVDFRSAILQGELPDFTCLLGTMVQEVYETNPAIRAACERHISEGARAVDADIAEAKRRYAPKAPWTPRSLALFMQAVIQARSCSPRPSTDQRLPSSASATYADTWRPSSIEPRNANSHEGLL